jgi:hypothetical protein
MVVCDPEDKLLTAKHAKKSRKGRKEKAIPPLRRQTALLKPGACHSDCGKREVKD